VRVSVFRNRTIEVRVLLGLEGKYMSTCHFLVMSLVSLGPPYHKYSCKAKMYLLFGSIIAFMAIVSSFSETTPIFQYYLQLLRFLKYWFTICSYSVKVVLLGGSHFFSR
jgi:hypothetical protein